MDFYTRKRQQLEAILRRIRKEPDPYLVAVASIYAAEATCEDCGTTYEFPVIAGHEDVVPPCIECGGILR